MGAKWGSWDESFMFLKLFFGVLSAVVVSFLPGLPAPLCMWHSFCMASVPGFQHLGTGCWNQSTFGLPKASCQSQVIPIDLAWLFPCCFSCFVLRRRGSRLTQIGMLSIQPLAFSPLAWPSSEQSQWHVISLSSQSHILLQTTLHTDPESEAQ